MTGDVVMQSKKMTRTRRGTRGNSEKQKGNEEQKESKERQNGGRAKGEEEEMAKKERTARSGDCGQGGLRDRFDRKVPY
jgi:hypothetical protein